MTKTDVLTILKASLNLAAVTQLNVALNQHLEQTVDAAIGFIEREGLTFTMDDEDENEYAFTAEEAQLVVMYAAYLYRKRATDEGMPRMLRWTLNNAIFSQKAQDTDDAT